MISILFFQFSENDETEIIPEIESCRSEYMTIFVGCTYAYKGVLMVRRDTHPTTMYYTTATFSLTHT